MDDVMTAPVCRWTDASLIVLRGLVEADRPTWGMEFRRNTTVRAGTVYPLLRKLVAAGWVTAQRERGNIEMLGRPLRVYYRLTDYGRAQAEAIVGQREMQSIRSSRRSS